MPRCQQDVSDCDHTLRNIFVFVTLVSSRVIVLPVLQELKELLSATLLKESHEGALDGLHLRARHFGDPAITVDEATSDLLKFQVTSDFGVDQNLREFTRGDDELGYEVDGIVPVAPKLAGGSLIWTEFAVELSSWSTTDACKIRIRHTWVKFKLALSAP